VWPHCQLRLALWHHGRQLTAELRRTGVPERPTSWQTFLRAHWGAIAGADFFTTEVWTWRGLVTFYTVFVIDLASSRVHIVGSTPHPDEEFMRQVTRTLTAAGDRVLGDRYVLICDRDAKWSAAMRARLGEAGIRVLQTQPMWDSPGPSVAPDAESPPIRWSDRHVTWGTSIYERSGAYATAESCRA
jgi:hypothetical protein